MKGLRVTTIFEDLGLAGHRADGIRVRAWSAAACSRYLDPEEMSANIQLIAILKP
jgi:hypothetical protein